MKKLHLSHLKHSPIPGLFSARKTLSARSTPMHLVYVNKNILFSLYLVDNHSLKYVDHFTGDCFE